MGTSNPQTPSDRSVAPPAAAERQPSSHEVTQTLTPRLDDDVEVVIEGMTDAEREAELVRRRARITPGLPEIPGYAIIQPLAEGGMGHVYLAMHTALQRKVALKVLKADLVKHPQYAERFIREARGAARLSHRNVVAVHDAGRIGDHLYLAMEYIPGGDLGDRINEGAMIEDEALRLIQACADGLAAIHQAGMVHRDIKPDNILLGGAGIPKIADLGLVRDADGDDRLTATGLAVGTPAYMSPEQASGAPDIDGRTDLYSLGATLFALLTGDPPFDGATPWVTVHKVISEPAPDPRTRSPQLSAAAAAIVLHAMVKDRGKRYQTVAELQGDLDAARAGRPLVHARSVPFGPLGREPAPRSEPLPPSPTAAAAVAKPAPTPVPQSLAAPTPTPAPMSATPTAPPPPHSAPAAAAAPAPPPAVAPVAQPRPATAWRERRPSAIGAMVAKLVGGDMPRRRSPLPKIVALASVVVLPMMIVVAITVALRGGKPTAPTGNSAPLPSTPAAPAPWPAPVVGGDQPATPAAPAPAPTPPAPVAAPTPVPNTAPAKTDTDVPELSSVLKQLKPSTYATEEMVMNGKIAAFQTAVLAVLAKQAAITTRNSIDQANATIEATLADGQLLRITLNQLTQYTTKLRVQIGDAGDKPRSRALLDSIRSDVR